MDHSTTTLLLSLALGVVAVVAADSTRDRANPFVGRSFVQWVTTERKPRVIVTPAEMDEEGPGESTVKLTETHTTPSGNETHLNETFEEDLVTNDSRLLAALVTLAQSIQQDQWNRSKSSNFTTDIPITDTPPTITSNDCEGLISCYSSSSTEIISISPTTQSTEISTPSTTTETTTSPTISPEITTESQRLRSDERLKNRSPWQEAYERWLQRYTDTLAAHENSYSASADLPRLFHRVSDFTLPSSQPKADLNVSLDQGFQSEFVYNVRGPGSRPGGSLFRLVNNSSQSLLPSVLWSDPGTIDNTVDDQSSHNFTRNDSEEESNDLWFPLPQNATHPTTITTTTVKHERETESGGRATTYTPAWIKDLETTEPPEVGRSDSAKRLPLLFLSAPKCTRPGDDLNLSCLLKRTPDLLQKHLTLTWKKIDYIAGTARPLLLSENSSLKVVDHRLSLEKAPDMTRLRLWNVSYQDTGIYQCQANAGESTFQAEITVRMCE